MKKASPAEIVVTLFSSVLWLGTLIAMFFIKHWTVLFVAIPHCLAFIWMLSFAVQHSQNSKTEEKKRVNDQSQKDDGITMDEIIFWDMIDDD
ncbi:MAG: hypothetical protein II896_02535 [Clostridia bacterium]|nr:hypothetical protein [Clostridia bacterium]